MRQRIARVNDFAVVDVHPLQADLHDSYEFDLLAAKANAEYFALFLFSERFN